MRIACDGVSRVCRTVNTFSTVHGNRTDSVFTQVLSDFQNKATSSVVLDFQSVQNSRKVLLLELDVNDGTNDRTYNNRVLS